MTVPSLTATRLAPLNQIVMLILKAVQVNAREDALPVFPLMQWGLANGVRLVHRRTPTELVRLRCLPDQQPAYRYSLTNVPGGLRSFEKRLLALPPRSAAQELLELLDMRLKSGPRTSYPDFRR